MKGERNTSKIVTTSKVAGLQSGTGNSATERGGFNVGGSVIGMSDFYLEVFAYFRAHPTELGECIPSSRIISVSVA